MRFVITRREGLDLADGINSFIFSLSDALTERGHDVHVISPTLSSNSKIAEYYSSPRFTQAHFLSDNPAPTHREMFAAWRSHGLALVKKLDPDLVIVNGALPYRLSLRSCIVSHDQERRWSYGSIPIRLYKMYCYRRCARVVATCAELRTALAGELAMSADSISVIPTCIDPRAFSGVPLGQREAAILHMGTASYKNPVATIEAFARMQFNARLYITGKPTQSMTDRVARLPAEVRERIVFPGFIDATELRRLLATVRIVSVPSDYYTPVASPTVLESFASGTPVVGSPSISGDLLVGELNGFKIDPRDPATAARCYERLLSDDTVWRAMSAGAIQRARLFDSRVIAGAYENLASEVSSGRNRRRSSSSAPAFP